MSVFIKRANGQKQKIAGHTILLDANVSEMRSGEVSFPALAVDGYSVIDIVFEDPMPDADYQVFLGDFTDMREYSIVERTTTGCRAYLTRPAAYGAGTAGTVKYLVFKPIKLEGYTELQNRIMNPDNKPTEGSENLVKSGGVWEAIKNASSVFVGTEAGWEAADHTKWDIAVLTDKHMILSVNRVSGESAEQANLNKVFDGTQAEWDALTDEQRDYYDHAMIKTNTYTANPGTLIVAHDMTVAVADWEADATYTDYDYKAEIDAPGVTSDFSPDVRFAYDEISSGIFGPIADTDTDKVIIYASEVPESAITIPVIICTNVSA
jgi:hypothetical protein